MITKAPSRRDLALVAAGGAVGAVARYGVADLFPVAPATFPTTTLAINLVGALALGALLEYLVRPRPTGDWRHGSWPRILLGIGLLGSFTTFSTFTVEIAELIRDHRPLLAVGYAGASAVGGIAACFAGLVIAGWRRAPVPDEGES